MLIFNPTARTDSPNYRVGQFAIHSDTGKGYVYVQANSNIGVNNCVVIAEGGQANLITRTRVQAFNEGIGVATAPFANSEYGWVQVYGKSTISVAAAVDDANPVYTSGANGAVDDASASQARIYGINLKTAGGAGSTDCYLSYPASQ